MNILTQNTSQESIEKKDTDVLESLAFLCAYNIPAVCYNIGQFRDSELFVV